MNSADPHRDAKILHDGATLAESKLVLILLHGRGATAEDIVTLGPEIADPATTAFLAPQAAYHSWYPNSFLAPITENEPWLTSALQRVAAIVATCEANGVNASRIGLCGFSQGACLATEFVARYPKKYAGLVAFTGGLIGPLGSDLHHEGSLDGMPALFSSGDPDPHVPFARVEDSAAQLKAMGAEVQVMRHPGRPHTIFPIEIAAAQSIFRSAMA